MLRKIMMACVAAAAIAVVALPTEASARWRGHGWHGGWHGGYYRGWGPRIGFYPYYGAYGYGGCWRTVRIFTPFGPRWRRYWVC